MENAFRTTSERITKYIITTPNLTSNQIQDLLRLEFGDDFYRSLKKFIKVGFNYSFKTDSPFFSSGIFLKKISIIYPEFKYEVSSTSPSFFKNMIMHKGDTKIRINNYNELLKIQEEFSKNFGIAAPKLKDIFEALIKDQNAIQKIIDTDVCLVHIKEIFSHLEDMDWQENLDKEIITNYFEKIEKCKIRERFEVDTKLIDKINIEIKKYQNEINKLQNQLKIGGLND